ncbi:beta-lactamase family protein [Jatrophihabitans telluris]|uniref:Beta-lactamase family protein n=1 Tax=Jatrophihabitans telluris TaxID=2038343 RepID=A0ABY4QWZ6_9ACTN|nr:serine hydrolase domain-containing protein [Jatrophihabitans telluris]UQX87546.1 beta-lactamase family protein [Jatrophihabitans telluris]
MNALQQLRSWPVTRAAAAVVSAAGVIAGHGDLDEPFLLASVTKPLTALATLVAVEEGALGLDVALGETGLVDASVAAQLPGATLRHLLAHASGIAPDKPIRAASAGTRRIYSNAGYDLIGTMVEAATEMPFAQYLSEALFAPLAMSAAELRGSPAKDAWAGVSDLAGLLAHLLDPAGLLHASSLQAATTVQFPGLSGVLPGFGRQEHNDWGLGFEIRDHKQPHWTGARNSPATYGHFGRSGTMVWLDPAAGLALVALSDRPFDEWAANAWPALSDSVLDEFGR